MTPPNPNIYGSESEFPPKSRPIQAKNRPLEKYRTCTPALFRTFPHKINNYLRLPLQRLLHLVFIFEFCILVDAGETVIIGREGHKKGCRTGAPILSHSRLSGKLENICIRCFDLIFKCFSRTDIGREHSL